MPEVSNDQPPRRESFGTPYLAPYTEQQLLDRSLSLIKRLFAIDLQQNTVNANDYAKVMDLLEIVGFGKEKYPYLLTIHVDRTKITEVRLWRDPHYQHADDENEGRSTAMLLPIDVIPDYVELSKTPEMLPRKIHGLTDSVLIDGAVSANMCFGGTSDGRLVLGRPDPNFFPEGKQPEYYMTPDMEKPEKPKQT